MQHALHRHHWAPAQHRCVLLRMEKGSRMVETSMVVSGGNAVIHHHGVCAVNARGLPTVTPGLTHLRDSYGSRKE